MRPGAPWCTQCWADLRPPPPPPVPLTPPAAALAPPSAPALPGQRSVGPAAAAPPGWPCATCGETNPVDLDACAACGAGFLAALRAQEEPLLSLPGVGDVTRLSRAQRIGLSGGVVVLIGLLVFLIGVFFG